jgi:hypothetical protein
LAQSSPDAQGRWEHVRAQMLKAPVMMFVQICPAPQWCAQVPPAQLGAQNSYSRGSSQAPPSCLTAL